MTYIISDPELYPDEMIRAYARPVPRYTSYPTAPHFTDAVGSDQVKSWLGLIEADEGVSLYIHIPYCDQMCWFCGCHTKQTKQYEPVRRYLNDLYREMAHAAAAIGWRQRVTRVHLGGGSPSLLEPRDLMAMKAALREHFLITPETEISVEIDPTDMSAAKVQAFLNFGVTRVSIGVQDFNPKVQVTINRLQSFEETAFTVSAFRGGGVRSINIDALYGLPHQTEATLSRTIEELLTLRPDRIALFGYAHVPWMKTHQRLIPEDSLPGPVARFRQARLAEAMIAAAGYQSVGIDHFALPSDALARAVRDGTLRRNFQGYTADPDETLIGFGTSSISQYRGGYAQNTKSIYDYRRAVSEGRLPIERGLAVCAEDRLRASVIEGLMCHYRIDVNALREAFGPAADQILSEAAIVAQYDEDGFFEADVTGFRVTPRGRPFVRTIASRFDRYFSPAPDRHSLAV